MKTIAEVFVDHCVFITGQDPTRWQNIFIVAASFELNVAAELADHRGEADVELFRRGYLARDEYDLAGGILFTDDRNPVEYIVAKTLRTETADD